MTPLLTSAQVKALRQLDGGVLTVVGTSFPRFYIQHDRHTVANIGVKTFSVLRELGYITREARQAPATRHPWDKGTGHYVLTLAGRQALAQVPA